LQEVKANYASSRVYPWLAEMIDHYRNTLAVKENGEKLKAKGELKGINWKKMKLEFEKSSEEFELMNEIKSIIEFALPLMQQNIHEGKGIYDQVEENLKLQAVGITPLKTDEGYLLLKCDGETAIHIYNYQLSFYTLQDERVRSLRTEYLGPREITFSYTPEKIKQDLILEKKELPNPAVYTIQCNMHVPLQETLLPIAKRYFVSRIAA